MSSDYIPPPSAPTPAGSATCPSCGTPITPGEAYCNSCGSLLPSPGSPSPPAQLPPQPQPPPAASTSPPAAAPDLSVGIWGPKSSGKTMYLYMLQSHIRSTTNDVWQMFQESEAAGEFIVQIGEAVMQRHEFPPPTDLREPEEYLFKFTKRQAMGGNYTRIMRVLDMPGEWYEDPQNAIDDDGLNVLLKYLNDCSSLLCLIDPDRGADEPMLSYLVKLLNQLYMQNKQQIDKKLAFCLTKMDQPQHRRWLQQPAAYIEQKLGKEMVRTIKQYCVPGKVKFEFACSAVGFYHGTQRSNSGIDWQGRGIIYDTHNIHPYALFKPLLWLFDETN